MFSASKGITYQGYSVHSIKHSFIHQQRHYAKYYQKYCWIGCHIYATLLPVPMVHGIRPPPPLKHWIRRNQYFLWRQAYIVFLTSVVLLPWHEAGRWGVGSKCHTILPHRVFGKHFRLVRGVFHTSRDGTMGSGVYKCTTVGHLVSWLRCWTESIPYVDRTKMSVVTART